MRPKRAGKFSLDPDASLLFFFGVGGKGHWFMGNYFAYGHKNFPDRAHLGIGARGLTGLRASFDKAPFDLFLELAPIGFMVVVPEPGIYYDIDLALGGRYRF